MLADLLKCGHEAVQPGRQLPATRRPQAAPALPLQLVDQPLGIGQAQARQLPDTSHGVYVLSARQQGIDFGPAACLVQERDQQLTYPGVGFQLSRR
jgi:hypothetical protein